MKGKLNWITPKVIMLDELTAGKNKIEIYSNKIDKIVYEYVWIEEITDEMLVMAKIESVLKERPEYMTQESIDECVKVFDKYFMLIINWKKLW